MRGVTQTSVKAPLASNSKCHTGNCTGYLIKMTWPHLPSTAARSIPLCRQQLYILGRLDADLVTHEGKRNIIL